jgi:ribosomal protein L13E
MNNANQLEAGNKVKIVKGCSARDIRKGECFTVREIKELGADYSHSVNVVLVNVAGRVTVWTARHINRLSDNVVNLNDGNPLHKIQIKKI